MSARTPNDLIAGLEERRRLLALAAPDLLDALKSAAAWLEKDGPLNGPLGRRIRAAIAKAEGR